MSDRRSRKGRRLNDRLRGLWPELSLYLLKAQDKTVKTIIASNSRPRCRGLCTLLLCISALWVMPTGAQTPTPITVTGPALRRADTAPNDLNLFPGDSIVISADTVMPSGAEGTTATAQTTNLSTGLPYGPIMIGPNPQPQIFTSSAGLFPTIPILPARGP